MRKQYIVHKKFQTDFTVKILLAIVGPMLLSSLFILFHLWTSGWMGNDGFTGLGEAFLYSFVLRTLPISFAIFVFSVLFSHRIAGPVRRMQKACNNLSKNIPTNKIILRKKDYFQSLADKLNLINEQKTAN